MSVSNRPLPAKIKEEAKLQCFPTGPQEGGGKKGRQSLRIPSTGSQRPSKAAAAASNRPDCRAR